MLRQLLLGTPARRALTLVAFGLVAALVLMELAFQVHAMTVYSSWRKVRADPGHFLQASPDPGLVFENKRHYHTTAEGRTLWTNAWGFRERDDDTAPDLQRIVLIGDSVTFGSGLDQDQTVPVKLQGLIDPERKRTRVFNCGVGGYGLAEMPILLRQACDAYRPHAVVYILNLNDFTVRDTVYEGADNGLYKMYRAPIFKTPWYLRKMLYRIKKPTVGTNLNWYHWVYRGTRDRNLPHLHELKEECARRGVPLGVVVMPSVHAYSPGGGYALQDIVGDLTERASADGILIWDPHARFAADPTASIDITDHFSSGRGCEIMAEFIRDEVLPKLAPARP